MHEFWAIEEEVSDCHLRVLSRWQFIRVLIWEMEYSGVTSGTRERPVVRFRGSNAVSEYDSMSMRSVIESRHCEAL